MAVLFGETSMVLAMFSYVQHCLQVEDIIISAVFLLVNFVVSDMFEKIMSDRLRKLAMFSQADHSFPKFSRQKMLVQNPFLKPSRPLCFLAVPLFHVGYLHFLSHKKNNQKKWRFLEIDHLNFMVSRDKNLSLPYHPWLLTLNRPTQTFSLKDLHGTPIPPSTHHRNLRINGRSSGSN